MASSSLRDSSLRVFMSYLADIILTRLLPASRPLKLRPCGVMERYSTKEGSDDQQTIPKPVGSPHRRSTLP